MKFAQTPGSVRTAGRIRPCRPPSAGPTSLECHQADRRNGLPLRAAMERPSSKPWNGHTKFRTLYGRPHRRAAGQPGLRVSLILPGATHAPAATAPPLFEQQGRSLLRRIKEHLSLVGNQSPGPDSQPLELSPDLLRVPGKPIELPPAIAPLGRRHCAHSASNCSRETPTGRTDDGTGSVHKNIIPATRGRCLQPTESLTAAIGLVLAIIVGDVALILPLPR